MQIFSPCYGVVFSHSWWWSLKHKDLNFDNVQFIYSFFCFLYQTFYYFPLTCVLTYKMDFLQIAYSCILFLFNLRICFSNEAFGPFTLNAIFNMFWLLLFSSIHPIHHLFIYLFALFLSFFLGSNSLCFSIQFFSIIDFNMSIYLCLLSYYLWLFL